MLKLDIYPSNYTCNIYILYNELGEGILVDPGQDNLKHIEKLNINIKYILITHGHYDHIGGLEVLTKAFPDAFTYIHKDDEICLKDPRYNLTSNFENSEDEISFVPEKLVLLEDNDELELLGEKVKVIHTPFHTAGSVCYYFPNLNILFSGDTLFYSSIGRSDLKGAEPRKMVSSLTKLKILKEETKVYPGHGCQTTIGRELKYNPYLNER